MESREFGYVYFARAGDGDAIKIGSTYDPRKRMKVLQIGCPHEIKLLAVVPAWRAVDYERTLHAQFDDSRFGGEWFHALPVMCWLAINFIATENYPADVRWVLDNHINPDEYWRSIEQKRKKSAEEGPE